MPDYEKMYFQLAAAVADATDALEAFNCGEARSILIAAQQRAKEEYIQAEEESI